MKSLGRRLDHQEEWERGGVEILLLPLADDGQTCKGSCCCELKTSTMLVLVLPGNVPRDGGVWMSILGVTAELDHLPLQSLHHSSLYPPALGADLQDGLGCHLQSHHPPHSVQLLPKAEHAHVVSRLLHLHPVQAESTTLT